MFASRLNGITPSPIAVLSQRARDLKAQGMDVIDLGVGEPDFDTPDFIKQATVDAMARGETKYTPTNGSSALRQAIRDKFRRENGLDYTLDEIAVSAGAKQIIFNAMLATIDPGDEVILPAPYWASYPDIVRIAGGKPVVVNCPQQLGFRLQPDHLEAAITPRTKWLFLNAPANPSGASYDAAHLAALAEVLLRHPAVWTLSDDIYEHLVFDGRAFDTIAQVEPRLRDRTLTLNGVSKTYAMTGWRLGYAGAPEPMIRAMTNVQTQCVSHASSLSQAGALAALIGPQDFLKERLAAFQDRRDIVVDQLNATPGFRCERPEGSFFVFPSCAGLIGKRRADGRLLASDQDVAMHLLDEAGVSTAPGSIFGMTPHIRISTAAAAEQLRTACGRIRAACEKLR